MRNTYNRYLMFEHEAIEDGRSDFNSRELYEMLYVAYREARKHKRATYDVQRIEANLEYNIYELAEEIANRTYCPSRSEAFITEKPVIREIFAASFRDRIVHHMLINICMHWWTRFCIRDSYSCRVGKGTDYGVERAKHHIVTKSDNYKIPTYLVKMDIKGFFMSMDRARLLERAMWGTHEQFKQFGPLGRLAAFLWKQIIMDDPLNGVHIRGRVEYWDSLPRDKSLFFQQPGRGIVIGNLTSQLLSNIYLDALDKFIVYELGYTHYGRYVDDFYVVINASETDQFVTDMGRISAYLDAMRLTLHPNKTKWLDVRKGVPYLGKMIRNGHIEMDHRYQKNYYAALTSYTMGAGDDDVILSFMGGCKNYGCYKMQERVWKAAGQDFYK